MSSRWRALLVSGCGLIAGLEAPRAGAWLSTGLSGPYSTAASLRPPSDAATLARVQAPRAASPGRAPALLLLATHGAAEELPRALGR